MRIDLFFYQQPMMDDTKDFLKETFGNDRKGIFELLTLGGNGSKQSPFILRRDEINDYTGDEKMIMNFLYKRYDKIAQRLVNNNGKNIDEIDIVCLEDGALKKTISLGKR
ncbi:MAG: hypothetical protein PHR61_02005 [Candidatus Absconditabacteria bacterium]|nr:hypothetical protein [Candidatus Absconditabacteria bacterium]